MRDFWRGMALVAISSQVGLDLKYFEAPDSVILVGMLGTFLLGYYLIIRREREEW